MKEEATCNFPLILPASDFFTIAFGASFAIGLDFNFESTCGGVSCFLISAI